VGWAAGGVAFVAVALPAVKRFGAGGWEEVSGGIVVVLGRDCARRQREEPVQVEK